MSNPEEATITLTSVFGKVQLTASDGTHAITLELSQEAVEQLAHELDAMLDAGVKE